MLVTNIQILNILSICILKKKKKNPIFKQLDSMEQDEYQNSDYHIITISLLFISVNNANIMSTIAWKGAPSPINLTKPAHLHTLSRASIHPHQKSLMVPIVQLKRRSTHPHGTHPHRGISRLAQLFSQSRPHVSFNLLICLTCLIQTNSSESI